MIRAIALAVGLASTIALAEDPAVKDFKQLAAELPTTTKFGDGTEAKLTAGAIDVRKTTSLITPIIGTLDFKLTMVLRDSEHLMDLRLQFAWKDGKWDFEKLLNQQSRKDITALPLGKDLLSKGALRDFLALHGL